MSELTRAVLARLEAIEAACLEPERLKELEADLLGSLLLAGSSAPEGRTERLRLDVWLGIGELDGEALLEVLSVVGGLASRTRDA